MFAISPLASSAFTAHGSTTTGSATSSAQASVSADSTSLFTTGGSISAALTVSAVGGKLKGIAPTIVSVSQLDASAQIVKDASTVITGETSVAIISLKIKTTQANIVATASFTSLGKEKWEPIGSDGEEWVAIAKGDQDWVGVASDTQVWSAISEDAQTWDTMPETSTAWSNVA